MKSPVTVVRISLSVLLLVLLAGFSAVVAQEEYASVKKWEDFDFAGRKLATADLGPMTLDDLKLVRGIVFGKHGRVFKDPEIRRYLESRDWYKPKSDFNNAALNDTERHNLDVIRIAEAQQHETVQPGDMRLYQNRALTRRKLGAHSNAEWTVLAAEVEAIHGKRFDDQPWLQQYFDERYWYRAAQQYDPKGCQQSSSGT